MICLLTKASKGLNYVRTSINRTQFRLRNSSVGANFIQSAAANVLPVVWWYIESKFMYYDATVYYTFTLPRWSFGLDWHYDVKERLL